MQISRDVMESDTNSTSTRKEVSRRSGDGGSAGGGSRDANTRSLLSSEHVNGLPDEAMKLYEEQRKAYDLLLARYNVLKAENLAKSSAIVEQMTANLRTKEKAADMLIQTLHQDRERLQKEVEQCTSDRVAAQAQFEAMRQENARLNEQVRVLHEKAATLGDTAHDLELKSFETVRALDESNRIVQMFQHLTSTPLRLSDSRKGKVHCRVTHPGLARVMRFDLFSQSATDDIDFNPVEIDLKGCPYPTYFRDSFSFVPSEANNLFRSIQQWVFQPAPIAAGNPAEAEHMTVGDSFRSANADMSSDESLQRQQQQQSQLVQVKMTAKSS